MYHSHWMIPCLYKKYLGFNCPGCGFQRSLIYLLEGNLEASISMYPALIPIILMCIVLVLHVWFKFSTGPKILLGLFFLNTFLITVNFIVKNLIG